MLFILITILGLSFVLLYFVQENISLAKLYKKSKFRKRNVSEQAISNKKLEDVQDNVLDFNAFKEAHQKQQA